MKKLILWTMVCLSMLLLVMAEEENLYLYDSLKVQLDVNGKFDLTSHKNTAHIEKVTADLYLYPKESPRQKIIFIDNQGKYENDKVRYEWFDESLGTKRFGYSTVIVTTREPVKVTKKILFPLTTINGYEEYTLPTDKIDSSNEKVAAKAAELAAGEDDLFKVVFKLATWVGDNVEYDLNSLTAKASQKASWVLDNKQGVCDEMTSLFIAMARSLGIPARFVSGISYTTSDLFAEPWQPHGWGEVYFPEIGWVGFDITFEEYGYIDVTHITLREGLDPTEPATTYEWLADAVTLNSYPLEFKVNILGKGKEVPEEIQLEQTVVDEAVGFGSYMVVKSMITNTANHYAAMMLQLAVPKEVEVVGKKKKTLLLAPREVKEISWLVMVEKDLAPQFVYQFPIVMYSEKNNSATTVLRAEASGKVYSKKEMEELMIQQEDKEYSQEVMLECTYPKEMMLGEERTLQCTFENKGSLLLQQVEFCLGGVCELEDVLGGNGITKSVMIKGEKVGWNSAVVSAGNNLMEKKVPIQYVVLDAPNVGLKIEAPSVLEYGQNLNLKLYLEKESFNVPENVHITLFGPRFESSWKIGVLEKEEVLQLQLNDIPLTSENVFRVVMTWNDKNKKGYSLEREFIIQGKSNSLSESVKMLFNRLLLLLS